jgi:hypothetical protein
MARVVAVILVALVAKAAPQNSRPPISHLSRPDSISQSKFDSALRGIVENRKIRVFRVDLAPHGSVHISRGIRDYVLLSVTGGSLEVGGPGNSYPLEMAAGEPAVLKGGWAHALRNRSDRASSFVLLETTRPLGPDKAVCGLGGPNCTQLRFGKTDQGEYDESLLFETGAVRLSRLQLGADASLPTHRDRLDHVVVPLSDGKIQINGAEIASKAGEAIWVRGGFPDFRVTGGQAMRFVIVELK